MRESQRVAMCMRHARSIPALDARWSLHAQPSGKGLRGSEKTSANFRVGAAFWIRENGRPRRRRQGGEIFCR